MSQEFVLAPYLFNIYTYDLLETIFRKYAYADDLAIMHPARDWFLLDETLSQDLAAISNYFQKLKLKLSTSKKVSACFRLNNWGMSWLHVQDDKKFLLFCAEQTYHNHGKSSHLQPTHEISEQNANISCCIFNETGRFRLGNQC